MTATSSGLCTHLIYLSLVAMTAEIHCSSLAACIRGAGSHGDSRTNSILTLLTTVHMLSHSPGCSVSEYPPSAHTHTHIYATSFSRPLCSETFEAFYSLFSWYRNATLPVRLTPQDAHRIFLFTICPVMLSYCNPDTTTMSVPI